MWIALLCMWGKKDVFLCLKKKSGGLDLDEEWVQEARSFFPHARNASDETKDENAQAGLLICRTACTFRFAVRGTHRDEERVTKTPTFPLRRFFFSVPRGRI